MKIVTFSAIKGGVGKTTLAYNYGGWLAKSGKKVPFIDLDHQCTLSQIYDIYDNEETSKKYDCIRSSFLKIRKRVWIPLVSYQRLLRAIFSSSSKR